MRDGPRAEDALNPTSAAIIAPSLGTPQAADRPLIGIAHAVGVAEVLLVLLPQSLGFEECLAPLALGQCIRPPVLQCRLARLAGRGVRACD